MYSGNLRKVGCIHKSEQIIIKTYKIMLEVGFVSKMKGQSKK